MPSLVESSAMGGCPRVNGDQAAFATCHSGRAVWTRPTLRRALAAKMLALQDRWNGAVSVHLKPVAAAAANGSDSRAVRLALRSDPAVLLGLPSEHDPGKSCHGREGVRAFLDKCMNLASHPRCHRGESGRAHLRALSATTLVAKHTLSRACQELRSVPRGLVRHHFHRGMVGASGGSAVASAVQTGVPLPPFGRGARPAGSIRRVKMLKQLQPLWCGAGQSAGDALATL